MFINLKVRLIDSLKYYSDKKLFYITNSQMCKNSTDIYNYLTFKLIFKNFFYFENGLNYLKNNISRSHAMLKNLDTDFMNISTFFIFNLNIRNQYPILNFKIREKSVLDFCKVIVVGFILNLNYYYEYESNLKFFFINMNNFDLKSILFYSENNFISPAFSSILLKFGNISNLSCFSNLNLLKFEFYKSSKAYYNHFVKYFSNGFFFNDFENTDFKIFNKNKYFFSGTLIKDYDYDFLFPLKQVFERSSMFLNIFGTISDFTFSSYRYFFKEFKNDWTIFKAFFAKCGLNFKFKLSKLKAYIFNKRWKYSNYNLGVYNYKRFIFHNLSLSFFCYDYLPNFFSDNLSKNNIAILFLYKVERLINRLYNYVFYNKIF